MSLVSLESLLKRRLRFSFVFILNDLNTTLYRQFSRAALCPATLSPVSGSLQCVSEYSRLLGSDVESVGELPVYKLHKNFKKYTPWTFSKDES
jgi:hypothetical protein